MSIFEDRQPGDVPAEPAVYSQPRTIVASAQRLDLKAKSTRREIERKTSREWQTAAWDYFDAVGEIRFGFNFIASTMSRVRLYPAVVAKRNEVPVEISKWKDSTDYESDSIDELEKLCNEALDQLDQGFLAGGLSEMQRLMSLNMQVAGEFFLCSPKESQFKVASITELRAAPNGLELRSARDAKEGQKLKKGAYVARIWRAHPRWSKEADSSMIGVLDQAEKLILLDRSIRATARSRMHSNLLFVPDTITVTPSEEDGSDSEIDALEAQLIEALTAPVMDESAVTSIVPLLMRGPESAGALIRLIEISRAYDPELAKAGQDALDRVLSGIDVPKDVVTGLANVKYANAIVLSDDLYRAHIEPLVMALSDALTIVYLRPFLRKKGVVEALVRRAVIWYDPSAIVTRPDRSTAANEGFDRGIINEAAWREARGFPESVKPDAEELLKHLAFNSVLPPDTAVALIEHFAPDAFAAMRANAQAESGMPSSVQTIINGRTAKGPETPETAPENRPPPTRPGGPEGGGGNGGPVAPGGTRPPLAERVPAGPADGG